MSGADSRHMDTGELDKLTFPGSVYDRLLRDCWQLIKEIELDDLYVGSKYRDIPIVKYVVELTVVTMPGLRNLHITPSSHSQSTCNLKIEIGKGGVACGPSLLSVVPARWTRRTLHWQKWEDNGRLGGVLLQSALYDPACGVLQRIRLLPEPGNPQTLNRYAY
jgi:hypothetical protein